MRGGFGQLTSGKRPGVRMKTNGRIQENASMFSCIRPVVFFNLKFNSLGYPLDSCLGIGDKVGKVVG